MICCIWLASLYTLNFAGPNEITYEQKPHPIDLTHLSHLNDWLRLVEEVKTTKTPRVLKRDNETVAMLMPVGTARGQSLWANPVLFRRAKTASEAK